MTSDPRALQYTLQTSSYNVVKTPFILNRSKNLLGTSILTTEGNPHKRHRKAMLPAFGFPETKALVHVFQEKATKVRNSRLPGNVLKTQ
jgi:cytochrome P450